MRSPVLCVNCDGTTFRVTFEEADRLVHDGLAEIDGEKRLLMKREGKSGGRLSLRVGAPLAVAVHRREGWARVALAHISEH
ncbi:MAG: hypothetical protein ACYDCG_18310 [Candidatus Acidiferrales bacterium]